MPTPHAFAHPPVTRPSLRAASRPTITDRFLAFDAQHPYVYRALERLTAQRLASGATRIGLKALFEDLRWQLPEGICGLNNKFTALYARKLIADHPTGPPPSSCDADVRPDPHTPRPSTVFPRIPLLEP